MPLYQELPVDWYSTMRRKVGSGRRPVTGSGAFTSGAL